MLLKLGLSLVGLGQRDAACATYRRDPARNIRRPSNAVMQRVKAETRPAPTLLSLRHASAERRAASVCAAGGR